MAENKSISYKIHDKNSIIVYCNQEGYSKDMKNFNGTWNGKGYLISKNKEKELIKFINSLKLKQVSTTFKSRKEQDKYHREVSESESNSENDEDEESSSDESEKSNKKKELTPKINKYLKDDPMLYYKSFKVKPNEFKKVNYISDNSSEDNISSSSSSPSSSSDDSFPEPRTPKKRKKYNINKNEEYEDLYSEVKSLQRKIQKMEIENKKLKSNKS
jgi:hypothetical protein